MKIEIPVRVEQEYKTKPPKKRYINLNNYHNRHGFTESAVKKSYENEIAKRIEDRKELKYPIAIEYYLIVGDKRIKDTNNVLSIVDKYFSDAIVGLGLIPDDNYKYITKTTNHFAGYEKGKARIIVKILEDQPTQYMAY